ncbi:hypothetical protein TomTYG75_07140 [Sphingobium sp. TomTYG75]
MLLKFIGEYTNGRKTITLFGHTFDGHRAEAVGADVFERLKDHPEFEVVASRKKKTDGD